MRTHGSLRHAAGEGTAAGACFPGRGLCCPDDPLELVLQLFPAADRAPPPPPPSLAALGIGGGGDPSARRVIKQEPESPPPQPQPLAESDDGGVGGFQDSLGFLLDGLWSDLEDTDVNMYFADDDALDNGDGGGGGGEDTQGNLLSGPTHMAAGGGGPVPNRSDASPFPSLMPAGAFPLQLQAYDACRASFDTAAVFNDASAAPPLPEARMPAGSSPPPPVFVTNNTTPPLPALIMPAAATPAPMPGCCPPPFFVTNNGTPPLPALIMPAAAPAPMPAGGAPPVFVTNNGTPPLPALIMPAAATPAPMPPTAASLHACGALAGIVSNTAPAPPPPLMAPLPARALHQNAAALAGVYSYTNDAPPSATPSSSPPSRTSFGSATSSSETEFSQHHYVWVVPRKLRSPPSVNRRKRPWLLDFPLRALPPVVVALPPQATNPTIDADVDDKGCDDDAAAKNRNAMALVALAPPQAGNNTAGGDGIRRRRPAPRQRNRQAQRVCSHCHSPETPQWRAGPDGPGTLCNACGIRYAANRLLPEYRPSTAPSFKSGQHSNRHRKVMKLREQMTTTAPATTDEEKPSSLLVHQQPMMMMEDDRRRTKEEDDDGLFLGACEYSISAAGL